MELKFEVYAKIKKPIEEVFEAVYLPEKLSSYFATGGASAPLDEGTEVRWKFHEFPDWYPVQVIQTVKNEKIVLAWEGAGEGRMTRVEIIFEALDKSATLVKVRESGFDEQSQKMLDQSYGNCMGWSQMLILLKVFAESGKNLREFLY